MFIVGLIHWLHVFFLLLYPLFFKNYIIDIIYLIDMIATILGWFLFNGECWVSYYFKKYQDKNYKIGDDVFEHSDMQLVIPIDKKYLSNIFIIIMIFNIILLNYVNMRSNILNVNIGYIISFIYIYYISYIRKFYNIELYNRLNIEYYTNYLNPLFSLILFLVLLFLIKKLYKILYKKV
jgi:hypothetical protein